MNQKLYVIGNGFDLHHGIPSRYSDFGRYLATVEPNVIRLIDDYLFVDEDFWNCFEERFATFDADHVIDEAEQFLMPYGAEDWSDSGHHDFEYEIQEVVDGISTTLRRRFAEWIRSLPMPRTDSVSLVRCIDPTARFLSFNYTPTLQELYGVADRNVLHIHGRAADPDAEIVIGHGWERLPDELLERGIDEDTDTRVAGGYRLIDKYFAETFKPTDAIIARNRAAFDCLGEVTEVWILGHSLADVDAPYFHELAAHVSPDASWTISCQTEPSAEKAGFAKFSPPRALAYFVPLSML